MKVIFGLGNPGKKYENTKHNIGFILLDKLAKEFSINIEKKAHEALLGIGYYHDKKILLVKPETYMNLSGKAVWQIIDYYSEQIEDFIVVYDDMDTPIGQIRLKKKGSSGGHNGIKSIIAALNSQEFDRLKIGIGQKTIGDVISHVLGNFSKEEKLLVEGSLSLGIDAIKAWILTDIDKTMNQFNNKKNNQ